MELPHNIQTKPSLRRYKNSVLHFLLRQVIYYQHSFPLPQRLCETNENISTWRKFQCFLPSNFAANSVKHAKLAQKQACLPASTDHAVPFFFLSRKNGSFSKNCFHFIVRKIIFQVSSLLSETISHNSHSIWFISGILCLALPSNCYN